MEKVTLKAVADRAGVSLATASKAINQRGDVKDTTRTMVSQAAAELGYLPRKRRSADASGSTVVLVFHTFVSPYALQILGGAHRAAARAGVDLIVATTDQAGGDQAPPLTQRWFRDLAGRPCRGVIAVTTRAGVREARWAQEPSLPLIVIDPEVPAVEPAATPGAGPRIVRISSTNWAGGRDATQHLIDLGHRRIGLVSGSRTSAPARERLEGYRSALESAGLSYTEDLVAGGTYEFEEGHRAATVLLTSPQPPTAIFASADTLALGALRAAHELGITVPDQLSIISFDDTPLTRWSNPQLSAVHQPLFSMGQVAVERALVLSEDPGRFAHPFQLETELIQRESTAPAPEAST